MSNLFRKALFFTDIHFGAKSNSHLHNEDCLSFVRWAVDLAKAEDCDTIFFLGDWHNNRATINVITLNFSLRALEYISASGLQIFFIPGNHDLYYRDRRDMQSVAWARNIPNIHIVNDWFKDSDVTIVPWLVGDDHKKISKIHSTYVLGHFELPNFLMNAMIRMPDVGEVRAENFQGAGTVLSGHFHKRQQQGNIYYIGNAFPHNYADAWDDERGCAIIEWGKEPTYHSWPDAPRFRTFKLSDILENPEKHLLPNTYARVNLDIDISYEEANFIKETFAHTYNMREISLIPIKNESFAQDLAPGEITFQSVDQIVTGQLTAINSEFYDPNLLLDIYRNL